MSDDAEARAQRVLDEWVRPVVEADGGGIELADAIGHRVVVRMTRLCAGCPGAVYTTERVLRPALQAEFGDALELEVIRKPSLPETRPAVSAGTSAAPTG